MKWERATPLTLPVIKQYKRKCNIYSVIGGLALVVGVSLPFFDLPVEIKATVPIAFAIFGAALYVTCWYYIKAKGRSGWWLLAPAFLNMIGLVLLLCLQDRGDRVQERPRTQMSGWARVRLVVAVIWVVIFGSYFVFQAESQKRFETREVARWESESSPVVTSTVFTTCVARSPEVDCRTNWAIMVLLQLLSLAILWIIAVAVTWTYRWVRQGFRRDDARSAQ
jgi:hypothetical protein